MIGSSWVRTQADVLPTFISSPITLQMAKENAVRKPACRKLKNFKTCYVYEPALGHGIRSGLKLP